MDKIENWTKLSKKLIKMLGSCQNHNVFTSFSPPKNIDNFLGKSKLNFWTKNEDFEQCISLPHYYHVGLQKIGIVVVPIFGQANILQLRWI